MMREVFASLKAGAHRSVFAVIALCVLTVVVMASLDVAFYTYTMYTRMRDELRIDVFVRSEEDILGYIELLAGIERVDVVGEEQALKEFRDRYPEFSWFLTEVEGGAFYPIVRVYPQEHWKDSEFIDLIYQKLSLHPEAISAYYGRDWIKVAESFFNFVIGANVFILLLSTLVTVMVSFYTVRFVVNTRWETVEVLRLAGVSPIKLRLPYIILSVLYVLMALSISFGAVMYITYTSFKELLWVNLYAIPVVLLLSLVFSVFGSLKAVEDIERMPWSS